MIAALKLYLEIVLLRRGPEDVPASSSLLMTTVALFVALNVALRLVFPPSADVWPIALAVSIGFALLWYRVLLNAFSKPERYLQVVTAIFGVGCWFTPIAVPLSTLLEGYTDAPEKAPAWIALLFPVALYMGYLNARILRQALERPLALCIALIVVQTIIEVLLVSLALGPQATAVAPGAPVS